MPEENISVSMKLSPKKTGRLYMELQDALSEIKKLKAESKKVHPTQDPKYGIKDNKLVNMATEKPIPNDEPIFIFRAQDAKAIYQISDYAADCNIWEHQQAVNKRVFDFQEFKHSYPERMKEPDTQIS